MAKLYTPEEIEALLVAERKATIAAIRNIPYMDIGGTCYRWSLTAADPQSLQKFIDDEKAADIADKEERGMNWVSLGRATEHTFPAGKYYIGDLCYVLDDELIDAAVCGRDDGFHTNGKHVLGYFSTAYGDGCYRGTNGQSYGVDAGMIGIVPVELIKAGSAGWGVLTFENEFVFGCTSDSTFYVKDRVNPNNSFEIPTKDDGEDEGEDEDEGEESE